MRDHHRHHRNIVVREHYEKSYVNKLGDLEEMGKFLEMYKKGLHGKWSIVLASVEPHIQMSKYI